jgi:hypothetical protein
MSTTSSDTTAEPMIWRMASSRCSSVFFCCADVALGQDDLHRLQEGHFLAHRLGLVQRAAQREGLAHGQRGIGKALLAVLLAQHMVGGAGQQRLVAGGQEAAVVEAVQHAAQHVELFQPARIGLVRIHRRPAAALAGGVFLQRGSSARWRCRCSPPPGRPACP